MPKASEPRTAVLLRYGDGCALSFQPSASTNVRLHQLRSKSGYAVFHQNQPIRFLSRHLNERQLTVIATRKRTGSFPPIPTA
jgi:hypothetical protein